MLLASALAQETVVTIYTDVMFKGFSMNLTSGTCATNISNFWAQSISSIRIQPGYDVVGYANASLAGYYMIWDKDAMSLRKLWNDRIMSYIVRPQTHALTSQPDNLQNVAMLNTG
ncbi:hypothetical protein THRCLA_21484 [Thraustotheca clavata]|uniref:Beta/gamma crystallin 'Greek key' domain-containing protein n=1 Tax=Thraustotheca clavata TaxID=74557 RepID=A0A1V9ZWN6_9STRA|nr:hypothetical protein THRCLA_21484 [Thraustotheca clavata]